jgi:hypothetical protein
MASKRLMLGLAMAFGLASVALLTLSAVELVTASVLDVRRPGRLLSLFDDAALFYAFVGGTIILGLLLGMLAAVVLNVQMSRDADDRVDTK